MKQIPLLFHLVHEDGYDARVSTLNIDSEIVFDLYIDSQSFLGRRSFRIVKRNGIWIKHDHLWNASDDFLEMWGEKIDEYLKDK